MIDGIYLHKLITNMKLLLIGARIEKIYHPKEKTLIFKLKGSSSIHNKLAVSIDPSFCTILLSSISITNPEQPTSFCMLLRKHLEGALITDLIQEGHERLVELHLEAYNELGIKTKKILHIELMGKYSNVILTENETIIDAIYKYPIGVNGFREILPRRQYQLPPLNEKIMLSVSNVEYLLEEIAKRDDKELSLSSYLQSRLQGFSKKSMRELLLEINMQDYSLSDIDQESAAQLKQGLLNYLSSLDRPLMSIIDETDTAFIEYYTSNAITSRKQKLLSTVKRQLKKLEKKAFIYQEKIKEDLDSDILRIKGEILSANLYRIKERLPYIELENYYEPSMPVLKIELNEALSPSMNVKQYFKKYHKVKEGKKQSESLLTEATNEIIYMTSIERSIEGSRSLEDLNEIQEELQAIGLLPVDRCKKKKSRILNFTKITLDNDDQIYIGKNNKQNDYLTFKFASKNDLWFHRQDYPGAHVILKSTSAPLPEHIELAAWHAAFTGNDEALDKASVDYTMIKYVKRHPSQKLGLAVYTDYSTIHIKR